MKTEPISTRQRSGGTFRSLRIRNYRLFFLGQLVSLAGTWMQTVALGWLVYEVTGSPTQIGSVLGAQFLPTLLGSVHGGLIADRFDKRKVILLTQTALAVQATALAAVTLTDHVTLPLLYGLAILQGMATTVDNPTRQAFVGELVGPDHIANAVGLNSAVFNAARIVGPAIGGIVIQVFGVGVCFAANAASFAAVIAGLLAIRVGELHRSTRVRRAKGQLREGFRYVLGEPTLRTALGMVAVTGLLAMNFNVVLPVVAKETFGGTAATYGAMSAVMGVGALGGALLAARRVVLDLRLLAVAGFAFGVSLTAAAVAPNLRLELIALTCTGLASITFNASAGALIQLTARPEMRGRAIALKTLFNLGSTPIGGPILGYVSEHAGPRWSLAVGAGGCYIAVAAALRKRRTAPAPAVAAPEGDLLPGLEDVASVDA